MPSWTVSAPENFKKSVQETAKKLGLSYGAYLRKAHRAYLETLTSEDFERAKKLIELQESKEMLSSLRERERILLREQGYKNKNVQRILKDIDDPEIENAVKNFAELREKEAIKQLKLHEELNPVDKESEKKSKNERKKTLKQRRMEYFGINEKQYNLVQFYVKDEGCSFFHAVKVLCGFGEE